MEYNEKIVYFIVPYMEKYNGDLTRPVDKAHERYNFCPYNGKMYGYIPTRLKDGDKNVDINIERISSSISKQDDKVNNVIVVFVGKENNSYRIVGWYKNATVYRKIQETIFENSNRALNYGSHRYQCETDASCAFQVDASKRSCFFNAADMPRHYEPFYDEKGAYRKQTIDFMRKIEEDVRQHSKVKIRSKRTDAETEVRPAVAGIKDCPATPADAEDRPAERVERTSQAFLRDEALRAWVKEQAGGRCELCGQAAPFIDAGGRPYLEAHHVVSLADGGPDSAGNCAALCPTCHRLLHYGRDRNEARERLYRRIPRLKRQA